MCRFTYGENLLVASRPAAEIVCEEHPGLSVIAIEDPETPEDEESHLPSAHRVLRLVFDDEEEGTTHTYHGRTLRAMSRLQAHAAALFADLTEGPLLIHCEGGVSRSAGVAAGLLAATGGDDTRLFRERTPNATCRRLVMQEALALEL